MDRRNEQQFIDRMHTLILGLSKSCTGCLRRGTQSCKTCWSNEANMLIADMNTFPTPEALAEKKDLDMETEQVLELVNAHLGITIKMIASSLGLLKVSSIQFIVRKLVKAKKISSSGSCPRVYFPASTPQDAIATISQTFTKVRKEKHGKS